jgi:diaminopimelate epimerase
LREHVTLEVGTFDNPLMNIPFTKMQGAGNDFVVLDETVQRFNLTCAQYQRLADRHFGVGADQILTVRSASTLDVDFDYVIHNADGGEVEQCGNGARCFVRFVRERGLTNKTTIKVRTQSGVLTLNETPDGQVTVDMGAPIFEAARIPYIAPLNKMKQAWDYVVSMGNPHAVCVVERSVIDLQATPSLLLGPVIQANPAFPQGVNVGFMHILDSSHIQLRVFERGSGETLACGTGACAAVVAGIQLGLLDSTVRVDALGGTLSISWDSTTPSASVMMTGPAVTVYQGTITV